MFRYAFETYKKYRVLYTYPVLFCMWIYLAQFLIIKKLFYLHVAVSGFLGIIWYRKAYALCFTICAFLIVYTTIDVSGYVLKSDQFINQIEARYLSSASITVEGRFITPLRAKYPGVFSQYAQIRFKESREEYKVEIRYPENIIWSGFPLTCDTHFICELHRSDFMLPRDLISIARFISQNIFGYLSLFNTKERKTYADVCRCTDTETERNNRSDSHISRMLEFSSNAEHQEVQMYILTILGAVFGRGEYIPDTVQHLFHASGLMHLLVISGYHLTALVACVSLLTRIVVSQNIRILYYMPQKRVEVYFIALFFALCFFWIDFNLPLWRAFISFGICSFLLLQDQFVLKVRVLIQSLCIMALLFPLSMFLVSVQLTYTALCGIILGNFITANCLSKGLRLSAFKQFLIIHVCAYVSTAPILYFWFDTLSLKSILCNLLFAVPFTYLVVICGAILSLCIFLELPYTEYIAFISAKLFYFLLEILRVFVSHGH